MTTSAVDLERRVKELPVAHRAVLEKLLDYRARRLAGVTHRAALAKDLLDLTERQLILERNESELVAALESMGAERALDLYKEHTL